MNREDGPLVLVVGDNQDHNEALARILEDAGYQVTVVGDAQEALAILRERPFDVVITDLRMPRMGGIEFLRNLRAVSPHLAVIIVTKHGEWTTYLAAMASGAVDYLNKPVRREDILMTIRKALTRRGIRAPGITPTDSEKAGGAAA